MRALIVVHSFTGNNRLLADELARRTGAAVVEVLPLGRRTRFSILADLVLRRRPAVRPLAADPVGYDRVLLVAPLWDRHVAFPMISALRTVKGRLGAYDFATLCGDARPGQGDVVRTELAAVVGHPPDMVTELHVADLLPEALRRQVRKVSGHRVSAAELRQFEPELAALARRLGASPAGSGAARG